MSDQLLMQLSILVDYKSGRTTDVARDIEIALENSIQQNRPLHVESVGITTTRVQLIKSVATGVITGE